MSKTFGIRITDTTDRSEAQAFRQLDNINASLVEVNGALLNRHSYLIAPSCLIQCTK
jgi:hypothetical protein